MAPFPSPRLTKRAPGIAAVAPVVDLEPAIPPRAVVTTITGLHVVMIMVHRSFADHVAVFVRFDITMMMIVMDDVRVAVAIDLGNSILIVLVCAHSRASQDERSDCQGKDCLFHENLASRHGKLFIVPCGISCRGSCCRSRLRHRIVCGKPITWAY
jgi:hypothetical protein